MRAARQERGVGGRLMVTWSAENTFIIGTITFIIIIIGTMNYWYYRLL